MATLTGAFDSAERSLARPLLFSTVGGPATGDPLVRPIAELLVP